MNMRPRPIIHINGFAGVGKLTIARELGKILSRPVESDKEPAMPTKLVHNHLLIDPAGAVLDRNQLGYQDLRRAIRSAIFKTLIGNPATYGTAYVFTDYQSQDEIGRAVCLEFRSLAASRGSQFIPILLRCEEFENLKRLANPERAAFGKLVDVNLARKFIKTEGSVHKFEHEGAWLELDVTELSAIEAAEVLAAHIRSHASI